MFQVRFLHVVTLEFLKEGDEHVLTLSPLCVMCTMDHEYKPTGEHEGFVLCNDLWLLPRNKDSSVGFDGDKPNVVAEIPRQFLIQLGFRF